MLNPRWAYFDTASAGPATRAVLAAEYRALEAVHADEQEFYAARYNERTSSATALQPHRQLDKLQS